MDYACNGFLNRYEIVITKWVGGVQTQIAVASRGSSGDTPPYYLQVSRSGNNWTAKYSLDGSTWTTLTTFTQALTIGSMGLLSNNFNNTPTNAQTYTSVFDYVCNAANDQCIPHSGGLTWKFPLSGTVGGGIGGIGVAPLSLNFANQTVGTTSSPQVVTISNNTGGPLAISVVLFLGVNASSYSQTNNCVGNVPAFGSCTINVSFKPQTSGLLTGYVAGKFNPVNSYGRVVGDRCCYASE